MTIEQGTTIGTCSPRPGTRFIRVDYGTWQAIVQVSYMGVPCRSAHHIGQPRYIERQWAALLKRSK